MVVGIMAWFVVMVELFIYCGLTKSDVMIFALAVFLMILTGTLTWLIYSKLNTRQDFHEEIEFKFFEYEGSIIIRFNVSTKFIMLSPGSAVDLARTLKKQGQKLLRENNRLALVKNNKQ